MAIFKEVWGLYDGRKITFKAAHRMLGRYFGYSECCIDAFLAKYPYSDGQTGDIHNDQFYCWHCLMSEVILCKR